MGLNINTDLVLMLRDLVSNLTAYAIEQEVDISFKHKVKSIYIDYSPEEILPELSKLICRIITFTPQSYKVTVVLERHKTKDHHCTISIKNTGVNLFRIRELTNGLSFHVEIEGIKKVGTTFNIDLPLDRFDKLETIVAKPDKNNLGYIPYYKEIENKLSAYFSDIKNMQDAAEKRSPEMGRFLRNVNRIVQARMNDHRFKVDALASAVALSRAQLFRKMKSLTNMSPSQYLLYFRLLEARELLETKENEYNVSEVCYRVGFISKSHFTRSFHKQFGFLPSNCK